MLTQTTATITQTGREITRKKNRRQERQGMLYHVVTYQHPLSSVAVRYFFDRETDAADLFARLSAKEVNG